MRVLLSSTGTDESITLPDPEPTEWLLAAAVVVVGIVASVLARRALVTLVRRRTNGTSVAEVLAGRMLQALVIGVAFVYSLSVLGVQVAPLVGALGIGGIAVALALQPTIENLFAGIVLHAQRPLRIGEEVVTGEVKGVVVDITSRAVAVQRRSGEIVHIPNSIVLGREIENLVRHGQRRTTLSVGVAYGTDVGEALEVDFWHGPLEGERREAGSQVVTAIHAALAEAGITIPFPQRTLWVGAEAGSDSDG